MSFKFKLANSKTLRSIVEALSSIIDETQFIVSPKGLMIRAMDPSRICLLQLDMAKGDFDEFECKKNMKVGLNLEDLDKILKRSSVGDSVSVNFDAKSRKFKIQMKKEGTNVRARTFSLSEIELEIEDIPMEALFKIDYSASWVMNVAIFVEAIKDAEIYAEMMTIDLDEILTLSSIGQVGDMEYEIEKEGLEEFKAHNSDPKSKGEYSIKFLKNIMKLDTIVEKLTFSLKTDHPLKLVFDIFEGGVLNYFLAPRYEEDNLDDDFLDDDFEEFAPAPVGDLEEEVKEEPTPKPKVKPKAKPKPKPKAKVESEEEVAPEGGE